MDKELKEYLKERAERKQEVDHWYENCDPEVYEIKHGKHDRTFPGLDFSPIDKKDVSLEELNNLVESSVTTNLEDEKNLASIDDVMDSLGN